MKNEKNKKEIKSGYTVTEVGAMLEALHKEIKLIAEGHSGLDRRLERLEIEVHGNSRRLDMIEMRVGILNDKVSHLEDRVSKLEKDLKEEIRQVKQEVREVKEDVQNVRQDVRKLSDRLVAVEAIR